MKLIGKLAALALFCMSTPAMAEPKVVLVTFDGVRWQEIFHGADPQMMADPKRVIPDVRSDVIGPAYLPKTGDPARALMPFLHDVVAREGVLVGDRDKGECAKVANDLWFSYPGYNEFLSGRPDPRINSNDKVPNPNRTFLEHVDELPGHHGKAAMAGTWDVFPYIVNTARTKVPVNRGVEGWPTDVKTARAGLELLRSHAYEAIYIAFGDTDEFAHAGDYASYLMSLERGDEFLRELWTLIQTDPYYKDQTTLIVLPDHGRGDTSATWPEHGSAKSYQTDDTASAEYKAHGAPGSGDVWFAALGPAVAKEGATVYRGGQCAQSAQVAASALLALGLNWNDFSPGEGAPYPPLAFIHSPAAK